MPGHIPWHKVDLPLRAPRSIWLSSTRPDGRPHAVPLWCWWDGDDRSLYFVTGRATQKARNLASQPWVVLTSGDGDDAIILEGPAATVTDAEEHHRIDRAYGEKYVDPHSGAKASIFNAGDDLYRVRVRHVMTWEYGVVATRTDWRFEDDPSAATGR
jgi:nitroimidazol reductase NimA-like FMN-containing flavoprotein (pyridoxamine 5'-phosphate oxidase superfamily)